MLIAFRAAEGNKGRHRCSLDGRNRFQPLADIGGSIIVKYRRSDNDEIIIRQEVFIKFLHIASIYRKAIPFQDAADKFGISARLTCLTVP